ncbi:phytoene/squalene synthase family protein [Caenispirillum salinarum]|uniref:phytoene/squalene synthase family protein n=1 Tax=Caenispirillum salinarum TaxID=859058 RepID=UPI00384B7982
MTAPAAPAVQAGTSITLLKGAARLLPGERRRDVLALGDACLAAGALAAQRTGRHAARIRLRRLRAALRAKEAADDLAAPFLDLHARCGLRLDMAELFVTTLLRDTEDPVIETWNGLIRYCHGSGGTVAVMLGPVLGAAAEAEDVLPFAIDLGIAVRLVDIARDVRHDAECGRVYLPAALLPRSVTPERLAEGAPAAVAAAHGAAQKLLKRAAVHFRSAESGLSALPPRSRAAVLVAIRQHEALGGRIADAAPETWWQRPTTLPAMGRTWRTGRTLAGFATDSRLRNGHQPPPEHVAALHRPLRGLPGVPRP